MYSIIVSPLLFLFFSLNSVVHKDVAVKHVLGTHTMSLENRQPDKWVNDVFKRNILLNIAYSEGKVKSSQQIPWDEIEKPFHYEMNLKPGEIFAFHDDVLPEFAGKVSKTTKAHFNFGEGFVSDGYLTGDGVCHLASLINWVARDAHLDVVSPTRHDFAQIPEVPKEYGVSIYNYPGQTNSNALQNLYIKNNLKKDVTFMFDYKDNTLNLSVVEKD